MSFLLLLLIVVCIGMVIRMINGAVKGKGNRSYVKRVSGIFTGYVAILAICLVLNIVYPGKGAADLKPANDKEFDRISSELYESASSGRIDKVDRSLLQQEWTFEYQEPQLDFQVNELETLNISVFVERKATNDGKIEAGFYRNSFIMNDTEIRDMVEPPRLKQEDEQLIFAKPINNKLKFSQFGSVFPVKQFTGESTFGHGSSFSGGPNILYLKIPKSLKLTHEPDLNIEFVN